MKKFFLMFVVFLFAIAVFPSNSHAVIFASDMIYLFEGGKRIKDNSVISKPANEGSKRFKVCENGAYYHRQMTESNEIIFFKTKNPNILTQQEWWRIKPDDRPDAENYNKYLEQQAQEAIYSKKIILPDATDKNTYGAPKNGMTGGVIGSGRGFKIDIVSGKIKYLKRK